MLRPDSNTFEWPFERQLYRGNGLWAIPEQAIEVGELVGEELHARISDIYAGAHEVDPGVQRSAGEVLTAALELIDYAGLSTERRANILRGVVNALEKTGALGGEPEWVQIPTKDSASS